MKNIYRIALSLFLVAGTFEGIAQKNVGIGTTQPDQSAVLDLQSSDKGLLVPRMSLQQRNAISQPAKGLLVYQTNESSGFYFYDGEKWKPLSDTEAKSVATGDINGWALNGNAVATATSAQATPSSFIGTPAGVPINFKIGTLKAGTIFSGENTFFGYQSGQNVSIPGGVDKGNTGIGYRSLATVVPAEGSNQGVSNVAIGSRALEANTTGSWNLAIGEHALKANTTGFSNTAIGVRAMVANINGMRNLAIGAGAMRNKTGGSSNTAIGVNALEGNLSGSYNLAIGYFAGQNETGTNMLYIANSNTSTPLIKGKFDEGVLKINVKPQVDASGNPITNASTLGFLAIGDFSDANFSNATKVPVAGNGYRLYVQDGVLTEKVKVALKSTTDWADYVFEPEYQKSMMSLEQVEQFAKENKHLPNVPSADEMATQGLDVGQTSKMFMEKIEELTLYMIELNKEVKALKAENEALKAKLK